MIKELRTNNNYTQDEMAKILQISLRDYVRIDNEQIIPRPDILGILIKTLNMNNTQIGEFIRSVLKHKGVL